MEDKMKNKIAKLDEHNKELTTRINNIKNSIHRLLEKRSLYEEAINKYS